LPSRGESEWSRSKKPSHAGLQGTSEHLVSGTLRQKIRASWNQCKCRFPRLAPNAGKGDDQAMPGKPTRFGVGLTLAEANMIDAALRCLEEADPSCSETSI